MRKENKWIRKKGMNIVKIGIVLLLSTMLLISTPQVYAKQRYANAILNVYGDSSCTYCHLDSEGGKQLTDYGNKFKSQPNYNSNPENALRNIGSPESIVTDTQVIPTVNQTKSISSTPAKKEESKLEDKNEKEEIPGFNILIAIGAIAVIYIPNRMRNKIRRM